MIHYFLEERILNTYELRYTLHLEHSPTFFSAQLHFSSCIGKKSYDLIRANSFCSAALQAVPINC